LRENFACESSAAFQCSSVVHTNTLDHAKERQRQLERDSHFGTVCRLYQTLNQLPSLEPVVSRIQNRLAISDRVAGRIRKNPEGIPSTPPELANGKERLHQLYDLVGIYVAALQHSKQADCLDQLCEAAQRLGFYRDDIKNLIREVELVVWDNLARGVTGDS